MNVSKLAHPRSALNGRKGAQSFEWSRTTFTLTLNHITICKRRCFQETRSRHHRGDHFWAKGGLHG